MDQTEEQTSPKRKRLPVWLYATLGLAALVACVPFFAATWFISEAQQRSDAKLPPVKVERIQELHGPRTIVTVNADTRLAVTLSGARHSDGRVSLSCRNDQGDALGSSPLKWKPSNKFDAGPARIEIPDALSFASECDLVGPDGRIYATGGVSLG